MARKGQAFVDGPASEAFAPVKLAGNATFGGLARTGVSREMAEAAKSAPGGECVFRGMRFEVGRPVAVTGKAVTVDVEPFCAGWIVFAHLSDARGYEDESGKTIVPTPGLGRLGEHAANYVIVYEDGCVERVAIRRRREIGVLGAGWGEAPLEAVNMGKPYPVRWSPGQAHSDFGRNQTQVVGGAGGPWVNWLYAWRNPRPRMRVTAVRFEPVSGAVIVSGISAGDASAHPLRWQTRRKAVLTLPKGVEFDEDLDETGRLPQIQLDLGQVISAARRPVYPHGEWARTYNNRVPEMSAREVIVEYTAHPDARFHFASGRTVAVAKLERAGKEGPIAVVAPATERVTIEIVEKASGKPVPVKLHIHGEAGEYLPPVDRQRIPNPKWFEDYTTDFAHLGIHHCTYVPGRTVVDLPVGTVYLEVSKGFEIKPVRKAVKVRKGARSIRIEIEKVLPWREKGWVSADTHVHFLSPHTAMLEGAGEGVNVVNLLASQWGELMTNVGDFDGRTTLGSKETGGDGEHLVRVGTENRQQILGHISLLGYEGDIIAPMTTGGPEESAIGDPVGRLLTEWARQCKAQSGVVIIPHFPRPRTEHAAAIVSGCVDGIEMASWGSFYAGINPYSLLDWYRYLNCGYMTAAVGGTDKMAATTAVGTVRTYARLREGEEFTYEAWKAAVRRAETFVTFGPLVEFAVEGRPAGTRFAMTGTGGTVDVTWSAASVTVPMSRVELIVNGEVREGRAVGKREAAGSWRVRLERSSWVALLVRGHYADKPEIITAHTSPVMVEVGGTPFYSAADAATILEQIEGALAFVDTVGTRAETTRYREMRMTLTAAYRGLHNRMHREGKYHKHGRSEGGK